MPSANMIFFDAIICCFLTLLELSPRVSRLGLRDMFGFRVPINDTSHITHVIAFAKSPSDKRAIFFERRKAEWLELSKLQPAEEIADLVLAGKCGSRIFPGAETGGI